MSSSDPTGSMIQNEELYLSSSRFESCNDLLNSVREFYYTKGYALSVRDSEKDKYGTLQCNRGGSYRDKRKCNGDDEEAHNGDKRKKKTASRLIDCPFRISGKKGSDGAWVFTSKKLVHNHDPSTDMSGHPSYRRLKPDDVQRVKDMTLSGIPPRQIISSLRQQTPNLLATSKTIYNLKAKLKKDDLGNRSMIGALFEELEKGGFLYDVLHDQQGHITNLFIAHPLSIRLAKLFSNTFVMDCTYKTNRYQKPLLDIIGVSCFNTSFYSGFAFLEKEDEQSYIWALNAFKKIFKKGNQHFVIISDRELALMNAIKNVFPTATSLLCVWHIEKNVLANCKKYFRLIEEFDMFLLSWNDVVYSTTEDIFINNWGEFELLYKEKKDAIEYIKKVWLPWKEKFVSAWTEKYLHFGNRTSSRAEGAHAKLKLYLQNSKGNFQEVKRKMCLAIEHKFNEIKVRLASERIQIPHNCNMPIFRDLLSNVSRFALEKIHEQYEKAKSGTLTLCTGHFRATMGLPCAHMIKNWQGKTLSLDLIHPQWRIDTLSLNSEDDSNNDEANIFLNLLYELYLKYQAWPLNKKEIASSMITKFVNENDTLFEPVVQRPKGRPPKPKKKKGITSTTRDPSKFELVESSQTRNSSTSTCVFQINFEAVEDGGYIQTEENFIDLNVYPEF